MYAFHNYKTKKAFKKAVDSGVPVTVFQPNAVAPATRDGPVSVEGPHYPEPHRWYARCVLRNGYVVKGSVK